MPLTNLASIVSVSDYVSVCLEGGVYKVYQDLVEGRPSKSFHKKEEALSFAEQISLDQYMEEEVYPHCY